MSQKRALKYELAAAALSFGMLSAGPAFADDAVTMDGERNANTVVAPEATIKPIKTIDPYNPLVPDEAFWGFCVLVAAMGAYSATKRKPWMVSGTLSAAMGLAVIGNPEWVLEKQSMQPRDVLVFIDKSESQLLDGRELLTAQAYAALEEKLGEMGSVRLRPIEFGATTNGDVNKDGTTLAASMQANLSAIVPERLGGVFVLSDGNIHDVETLLNLQGITVPVHALISGHESEIDFALSVNNPPRFETVSETHSLNVNVNELGAIDKNYSFLLSMEINGQSVGNFAIDSGETKDIPLPQLFPGMNNVELSIAGILDKETGETVRVDEVTTRNNVVTLPIEGLDDNPKILVLSGSPNQTMMLWQNTLQSDPNIDFVQFASIRPAAKDDGTPLRELATTPFPVHELLNDRIYDYDTIILSENAYDGEIPLAYMDKIIEWTEAGGGLVLAGSESLVAGNSYARTKLMDILPLVPGEGLKSSEFKPQLTEDGRRHPWGRLLENAGKGNDESWGSWYELPNMQAKQNSQVLLDDGQGNPLLAIAKHGKGRVAVLASDQVWLWDRGHKGGGPARELYLNLARWASGHHSLDEENVIIYQNKGELVVDLQTMGDAPEEIVIVTPSGLKLTVTPEEISPGLRRAVLPVSENGVYKAERKGAHEDLAFASIGLTNDKEFEDVVSKPDLIEPLTRVHSGITARMTNASGNLTLPELEAYQEGQVASPDKMGIVLSQNAQTVGVERSPFIPDWLGLAMALGLFGMSLKQLGGKTWRQSLLPEKWANNNEPEGPAP